MNSFTIRRTARTAFTLTLLSVSTLGPAHASDLQSQTCAFMKDMSFRNNFFHQTLSNQGCTEFSSGVNSCDDNSAKRWNIPPSILVYNDGNSDTAEITATKGVLSFIDVLDKTTELRASITNPSASVRQFIIEEGFDTTRIVTTPPNLLVLLVDETIEGVVERGEVPLIDTTYYQTYAMPKLFDENSCLTRVGIGENNTIGVNVILAGTHLDQLWLEQCIKDNLFHGAGLVNAPIGQTSISTGIEGVADYTEYQEAQMYLLYALPDVSVASYDAYFASHCER